MVHIDRLHVPAFKGEGLIPTYFRGDTSSTFAILQHTHTKSSPAFLNTTPHPPLDPCTNQGQEYAHPY